ncbi:MAG: DUF1343 domain-containing protein [Cyclobacteriaceae bacterium]|nr:DUF1343 domain-containing protein [Cyclobacteriaceae bacterium]MCH8514843.1 DUF1343 domain-containing protein [Cyclobacteriaceae bacterium]
MRLALFVILFSLHMLSFKANPQEIILGIEQTSTYINKIEGKSLALVVNHTSLFPNGTHLADSLMSLELGVKKIMSPEHGFRGNADAGAKVNSSLDEKTGLPIISLYGNNKKPSEEDLSGIDLIIFDLQDVGTRFYTYISTMHYVMEAAAENGIKVLVLDRPNPNGHYIDGPILNKKFSSFVGLHPIPVVHGLTVAELAFMINEEGWLQGGAKCDLEWIPVSNYNKDFRYKLPVKPSPNLPNSKSIEWYPSLCFFEGTPMSIGRGTDFPFQVIGYPNKSYGEFSFTPVAKPGAASNPKHKDSKCYGVDLRNQTAPYHLDLSYLIDAYEKSNKKDSFFTAFFDKLAGTDQLKKQIMAGLSPEEIKISWNEDLEIYKEKIQPYLIYPISANW